MPDADASAPPANATPASPPSPPTSRAYPHTVERLIEQFARLPGIGRRSAERLAFHVMRQSDAEALELARAVEAVKRQVRHCAVCFSLADDARCALCEDARRDRSIVLVVEQPRDLIALEHTGLFRGVYHVLLGRLSPLDGVGPGHLTIADLLARIDDPARNAGAVRVAEVVLGLNPTLEGDATALYLTQQLAVREVKVSRLARGLAAGSQMEFASKAVLADALEGRQALR